MIPKSCRLFGQDHATKQVIRAKWRFNLIPFRSNGVLAVTRTPISGFGRQGSVRLSYENLISQNRKSEKVRFVDASGSALPMRIGQGGRLRSCGLLRPRQALLPAELRPDGDP